MQQVKEFDAMSFGRYAIQSKLARVNDIGEIAERVKNKPASGAMQSCFTRF
ncbi:MAG: hypothetical protein ON057_001217 [Glomeribacter sp. 1016415]|nr:hypothetical protein [Glomeribacter sp. 1016415]